MYNFSKACTQEVDYKHFERKKESLFSGSHKFLTLKCAHYRAQMSRTTPQTNYFYFNYIGTLYIKKIQKEDTD